MRTVLDGGGLIQTKEGVATAHWHAQDDERYDDCHWCQTDVPLINEEVAMAMHRSRDARVSRPV